MEGIHTDRCTEQHQRTKCPLQTRICVCCGAQEFPGPRLSYVNNRPKNIKSTHSGVLTARSSTQRRGQGIDFCLGLYLLCYPKVSQLNRKVLIHNQDILGFDVTMDPPMLVLPGLALDPA